MKNLLLALIFICSSLMTYGGNPDMHASFAEEDTVIIGGYLPHYRMNSISPDIFDYLTHLYYFSVSPDSSGNLGRVDSEGLFTPVEEIAEVDTHMNSLLNWRGEKAVKIFLVVGGWVGSDYFDEALSDPGTRAMLVANIKNFIDKYGIDGVDLDWETYKGEVNEANYGLFIDDLRSAFAGTDLQISAAVNPLHTRMIEAFSNLDFLQLMSYGRHFGGDTQVPMSTLESWVDSWIAGGYPASKLLVGIPFFGKTPVDNSSILYRNVISWYNPPPDVDRVIHDGISFYFNGVETVARKAQYVLDEELKGAMIWEVGQDVALDDSRSLLRSVHKTIFPPSTVSLREKHADQAIRVFPNPVHSVIHLESDLKEVGESSLFIQDICGRVVWSSDAPVPGGIQSLEIDVADFPPGVYFIHHVNGSLRCTGKFVKQ